MGHKRPDLDAIGAAIGVSRFALMNNLEAYVVLNESDIDPTLRRVMDEIDKKPELKERFVTSDEAWDMMTSKTTVVVVDTHKPEMVLDRKCFKPKQTVKSLLTTIDVAKALFQTHYWYIWNHMQVRLQNLLLNY